MILPTQSLSHIPAAAGVPPTAAQKAVRDAVAALEAAAKAAGTRGVATKPGRTTAPSTTGRPPDATVTGPDLLAAEGAAQRAGSTGRAPAAAAAEAQTGLDLTA